MPMTHATETGAENRLPFFQRQFLVRVMQICDHIRLVPETVRVTEIMIYRRLLFIFVISCKQSVYSRRRAVIYLFIVICRLRRSAMFIFAPEIFIPDVYGTKNRRRKPAP